MRKLSFSVRHIFLLFALVGVISGGVFYKTFETQIVAALTSVSLSATINEDVESTADLGSDNGAYRWSYDPDGGGVQAEQDFMAFNMPFNTGTTQTDFGGSSKTGTATNMVSPNGYVTSGKAGGAMSFDGANDYVSLSGTHGGGAEATISAWVNIAADTGTFQTIVGVSGEGFVHFQINYPGGAGNIAIYTNAGQIQLPMINVSTGAWHHLVLSLKTGASKAYVDGNLVSTNTTAFSTITSTTALSIGRGYAGGRFFNGSIDEVQIYNSALTEAQIDQLCNDGDSDGDCSDGIDVGQGVGGPTLIDSSHTAFGQVWDLTVTPISSAGVIGTAIDSSTTATVVPIALSSSVNVAENIVSSFAVAPPVSSTVGYQWNVDGSPFMALHMPFNLGTTQRDISRNTLPNNGTVSGSTFNLSSSGNCQVGGCMSFDGNDSVSLGTSSPFRQSDAISYSFWTKMPNGGGGYTMGTGASGGHGYGGIIHSLTSFAFSWTPTNPGSDRAFSATLALTADQWHHIVFAIDYVNQTAVLYVDGNFVSLTLSSSASDWTPVSSYNSGQTDYIGARYVNSLQYFNGSLDEVQVYSRILSAAQIAQHYADGTNVTATDRGGPTEIVPEEHNLAEVWQLNAFEFTSSGAVGSAISIGSATIVDTFLTDISGSCLQADGVTACSDDGINSIKVAVNGVLQAGKEDTMVDGSWSIADVSVYAGDVITVFIDGGAGEGNEAVAITKYVSGNITGMQLIEEHLTVGSADNQTITNADLGQYDNSVSGDEDIFHDVTGSDLVTDGQAHSAHTLMVLTGNTFSPGGSVSTSGSWDNNGSFLAGGALSVTTLNNTSGTLDLNGQSLTVATTFTNDGMVQLKGTETISLPGGATVGAWKYVGSGVGSTLAIKDFGATDYSALIFDDTNGTLDTFTVNDITVSGATTLTAGQMSIASGTFSTGSYSQNGGTFSSSGGAYVGTTNTFTCTSGTFDSPSGGFTEAGDVIISGTCIFNQGGAMTVGGNLQVLSGGIFNGSNTGASIDVNGSVDFQSTADTVRLTSGTMTVAGDWTNRTPLIGFDNNAGTVRLDTSSAAAVNGSTVWRNLVIEPAGKTVTFEAGELQMIETGGDLSATGASGNLINFVSSDPTTPTQWEIDHEDVNTGNLSYVSVTDGGCFNSANIFLLTSTSVSNNDDCWKFLVSQNISGSYDGANGSTVRVAVDGTLSPVTTTTSGGLFTLTNVDLVSSGRVLVFVDGVVDANEAMAMTKYDGAGDITGVQLLQGHLTIGSDDNATVSNADLALYDNGVSLDEDIFFEVDANNDLVVDFEGGHTETLMIVAGNTYQPDSGSSGNVTTHHLRIDGVLTADANTITVGGAWDNNGTFNAGTSTVVLSGTAQNISGSTSFYSLTKSVTAPDTLTIDDNTTLSTLSGGVLTLTGTSLVNKLTIRSNPDSGSTQWFMTHHAGATESVTFVDLKDAGCTASSDISLPSGSIDSGNNDACWVFTLGDATQLDFGTAPPSSATIDQTWSSFTVRIEDEYGILRSGDTNDVTIALSTGTGTLSGTVTKAAVNGVATFDDISYDTVETITIEASSGGGGSAQWTVDGVGVSTATNIQISPQISLDGSGGSIITWQDFRSGTSDVYAQRLNVSGVAQWTTDGVVVSAATGSQTAPQLVSDGSGGAIITWYDNRGGFNNIYAQRINSSGVAQWTADGVAISTVSATQLKPQVISDGSGGAIITWYDNRSSNNDIYAQRVNSSGVVQWTANGVVISAAANEQITPEIISDGSGGAIITWDDSRAGKNIYAQRVNSSGVVQWTANGVGIRTGSSNQLVPRIVSDGSGGGIITWHDNRSGNYDIYAQRVNSSGVVQWTANGVAVSTAAGNQTNPYLTIDGSGGAIITWSDGDVYTQKINSSGVVQWTTNGVVISAATSAQTDSRIISDGFGGAIISWRDSRSGNYDIYAQKIDSSGVVQWMADGVAEITDASTQNSLQLSSDGSDGAIIIWSDARSGNDDIYAQSISGGVGLTPVESGNIIISGYTLSGRLYSDEGVTAVTSADQDVTILVNGVVVGTDTTDSSGDYAVTNVSYSGDDVITVFVDGEIEKAVLVTLAPTSPADITGLDLYYDHLIVRHENAGPLTNANLGTADNADADINAIYSESAGVVTVEEGKELSIWTGNTYAPGGNISLGGNWDNNGTFTAGTSTVDFTGANQNISGNTTFYSLTKSVSAPDTLTIDDNTTISTLSGGVLTLTGTSLVNKLTIRSNPDTELTDPETSWFITHNAAAGELVQFVDLQDAGCTASSDVTVLPGWVDSGNNDACWVFTVGDATQLDFGTAPPSSATIDQTWSSFTVRIEDEYGNLRSGDTDDVTIALSTGTGTLSGTVTKAAVNGVATFDDISYDTVETITIEASSGSGSVEWTVNGVGVSTATGNQNNIQMITDGSGGAIMTWYDNRGANTDVYAQKTNASGVMQWTADGVAISTATGNQAAPQIISDGAGGAIITWQDLRSGTNDIYAQRVNASGAVQWTADGVPVSTATGSQQTPKLISDGAGGAIITWTDVRSGTNDIYAQRVNASGAVQWTADGVSVSAATGSQQTPRLTSDGAGGAIIAWMDARTGDLDIWAQRINASGVVQWTTDGVAISVFVGQHNLSDVIPDGSGGALISYYAGSPNYDVYVQRINASGVVQWTTNGVVISNAAGNQNGPYMISDGAGGATISWYDLNGGIWAQRVNGSGVVQWAANGVIMSTATGSLFPMIASDGGTGAIITWYDSRSGNNDVYAQRVNVSGVVQWTTDGVAIGTGTGNQSFPQIAADGSGGAIIAWHDNRSGNDDIYAQKISGVGLTPVESGNIDITGYSVSGRLYSDEGVTAVTSADKDVTILVNGVVVGTDTTDSSGDYAVTNVLYSGDDVITVFVDGEIEKAVLVTLAPTSPSDITGLDLYYDHLIVRHENAGPLTNANLGTADNADADINAIYSEAGGVVTVGAGKELSIWTGNTYAPGGNISIGGDWNSSGAFTAGSSSVDFTGSGTQTFTSAGDSFATITHSGSGTLQLAGGALSVTTLNNSAGTIDLNGQNLTVATTFTNDGTIQLKGSETISLPGGATAGAWRYVGSGVGTTLAIKDFGVTDYAALTISDPNGASEDTFTVNDITVTGDTTLTAGQVDIGAGTFTTGTYTQTGGAFTNSGGAYVGTSNTYNCSSGTVDSGTFTEAGDLNISGTCQFTQTGPMNVEGAFNLSGGTFNDSADNFNLAGDWNFTGGTATLNEGTVILDGSAQTVNGATTFFNFKKDLTGLTAIDTLLFEAGVTQTIVGELTLKGDPSYILTIDSTTGTGAWTITHQGTTESVSFIDLSYGACSTSNDISTSSSIDSGNNGTCWIFQDISGTYDGPDGSTVRVAVNGTLSPATTTTGSNAWTLPSVTISSGDVITVFIDGVLSGDVPEANEAVAVTKYDGTGNVTGVQLLQGHLTIGSDDNATVSNADLALYDYDNNNDATPDEEDIFFEVDANNDLVVDFEGGHTETLMIVTGNTFQPDSGSSGNVMTHHLRIDGVLTADANTITVGGAWDNNGTFNAGTSTVVLSGTAQNISGSTSFYSLTKSVTAPDTLTIDDNTTLSTLSGGVLTLTGTSLVNKLTIRSNPDSGSTQWFMTHHAGATESVTFVDLKDAGCTASSDVTILPGWVDSGNNDTCWVFTVGDATQLDFGTAPPSSATIDQTWSSFTVRIEDEYGNLRSGDTNDVTIALSTGTGTLSGTVTKAAVNGVATFDDISYDTVETITIEATSGGVAGTVQWTVDGVPIAVGTADQNNPISVSDGAGGAITVWTDDRAGNTDLYAQRFNFSGAIQWTLDGVSVVTATGLQFNHRVVSDDAGGAIVAWTDYRSGNQEVYVQKINSSGVAQWTANGVALTSLGVSDYPVVASDGAGGAIVAWTDFRSGTNSDIYAQRVDSSGAVQWTANGVAISVAAIHQQEPEMVSDGAGGAIVSWTDMRVVNGSRDLYAQRINASGVVQWTVDGVVVSAAASDQFEQRMIVDGSGGVIITWYDYRGGVNTDIYAQKMNSAGIAQWTADGAVISAATGTQNNARIVTDGSGGAIIAWTDERGIDADVYSQMINSAGAVQWTANGVAISTAADEQSGPNLATDGAGGAIIAWSDLRNGLDYDVYSQRIDSTGSVQWTANGVLITAAAGDQSLDYPLVSDGAGGAILVWQDERTARDIYAQRISGVDGLTPVESGNIIINPDVPEAVADLAATGGDTEVVLTWSAPANNGSAITDYIVEYGATSGFPGNAQVFVDGISASTGATVTGLSNATNYSFRVKTVNGIGESGYSNVDTATPVGVPVAIADLAAASGNAQAVLTWSAPADNGSAITDYIVEYGATSGFPGNAQVFVDGTSASTGATVTGLSNGTDYSFRVKAVNAVGESAYSNVDTATPATVPDAVTDLAAAAGNTQAVLTWSAPANNGSAITDYIVEYGATSGFPGNAQVFVDGTSASTGATVTGLSNATNYSFRVKAVNGVGESNYSNVDTATPAGVPEAVADLDAVAGDTEVVLTWSAPADNGSAITDYIVEYGVTSGFPGNAQVFVDGTSSSTGATVTGLSNGTDYSFRVKAVNAVGESAYSNVDTATPAGVPVAVSDLDATSGNTQVSLTWSAPADNGSAITDYIVEYGATSGFPGNAQVFVDGTSASTGATVTGLSNGTNYSFRVKAVNGVGESGYSNVDTATPVGVPEAIADLAAASGNTQVVLTWSAPANNGSAITDYVVEYGATSGFPANAQVFVDGTSASTGATVTGLSNGTEYSFRVKAVNAIGESAYSNVDTATPATVPSAVSDLSATTGNAQIPLTWSAPSNNGSAITDYLVEFGITSGFPGNAQVFNDGVSASTGAIVSGLVNGTEYSFRVKAVNAVGESTYSNVVLETPMMVAPSGTQSNINVSISDFLSFSITNAAVGNEPAGDQPFGAGAGVISLSNQNAHDYEITGEYGTPLYTELEITTNSNDGYSVTIYADNTDNRTAVLLRNGGTPGGSLDQIPDSLARVADTQGANEALNPATATGIGFRLVKTGTTVDIYGNDEDTQWGSNDTTNALWASPSLGVQKTIFSTLEFSSTPMQALINWFIGIDVTQRAGTYSGEVILSALPN